MSADPTAKMPPYRVYKGRGQSYANVDCRHMNVGTKGNRAKSGNATNLPPHLHHRIYRRLLPLINPLQLLARAPTD